MRTSSIRSGRLGTALAAVIALLMMASCSVTDDLLGNETDDGISSAAVEESAEGETGSEVGGPETAAEEVLDPDRPSIWVRGDDASMRPTTPLATVKKVIAPGNGHGWTILGSVFDYSAGIGSPAVWSAEEPSSRDSWTRVDLEELDGRSAGIGGVTRTADQDVAVGNHGQGRDGRPSVWVRPAEGEWRVVERSQFERGVQEWFSHVAVNPSNGLVVAYGAQKDAENISHPVIWVSQDGEAWEAIDDLPFSADGNESFQAITPGPTASVLTGSQSGTPTTAIAYWSRDGRTWTEAEVETPSDGGRSYLGEAAWFNDRFVAVGGVATGQVYRPAAWSSSDGKVWELQQTSFELLDDGRTSTKGLGAVRIASTDSMLYAAASASYLQQLWQSSDGVNWTTLGDITGVRSQGLAVKAIVAVEGTLLFTTDQPGVVTYQEEYEEAPLRDELLPVPSENPWVSDINYVNGGWVAVGGASIQLGAGGSGERARLWRSTNGSDWELAEQLPESSTGAVNAVVPLADGLAAVGTESVRSAAAKRRFGRGLIWELNGAKWAELFTPSTRDDDARIGLLDVADAGGDLLAAGWRFDPTGDNTDALLVQSNADGEPEPVDIGHRGPDNEVLKVVCGNEVGEAVAVVSAEQTDGLQLSAVRRGPDRQWSDAAWPTLSGGERAAVTGCAYGVDGFLVSGATFIDGADQDVGLWRSPNGTTWERVEGPPSFSGSANQSVNSIAATEDGYLLAGNDVSTGEVRPVIWYGSGDNWGRVIIDEAETMGSLKIGYAEGSIVVAGWNDGAVQIYSTTLEQLKVEAGQS